MTNIKWLPRELFAWMDAEQLREILNEVQKRDPQLIENILAARGYHIFESTVRGSDE
jgi:hypothetical protein